MRATSNSRESLPLLLNIPGLDNSGPAHWQSLWEVNRDDCVRVDLGMWDRPHRNTWINKINAAVAASSRPVVLVAHSLGCHAVAWWNQLERPDTDGKVLGALLVAPPNVEGIPAQSRLAAFSSLAREALRFPSIVAASRDDNCAKFGQSRKMARLWGSRFVDAGWLGHINAESGLSDWPFGQFLVERLILCVTEPRVPINSFEFTNKGGVSSIISLDLK